MKKLLVFFKGSSIHRTAFSNLSTLYPSIELSTYSIRTLERDIEILSSAIAAHTNDFTSDLQIIALGDYGSKVKYIRIELTCINIFRKTILGEKESYKFNSYFELIYLKNMDLIPKNFKLKVSGMKNGRCNLFCYKFNEYLSELPQNLNSKLYFDFLHVPRQFRTTNDLSQILGGTNINFDA